MIRKNFLPTAEKYAHVLKNYGLNDVPPDKFQLYQFEKSEFIYRDSCPIPYLFFILSGRVKTFTNTPDGKVLLHSFMSEGNVIGELEFLKNYHTAVLNVQTVTPCLCLAVPLKDYGPALKNSLIFMTQISLRLADKLTYTNYKMDQIILYDAETRLCSYIEMTNDEGYFRECLTEVADLLGTSYRHLLRTLEKLCKEEILQKLPRGYRILNLSRLHQKSKGYFSTDL